MATREWAKTEEWHVGQKVEVYSFGHWYAGEVIEVKKVRVVVRYTTGSGTTREKAYTPPSKIRKLDEARGEASPQ